MKTKYVAYLKVAHFLQSLIVCQHKIVTLKPFPFTTTDLCKFGASLLFRIFFCYRSLCPQSIPKRPSDLFPDIAPLHSLNCSTVIAAAAELLAAIIEKI